MKLLEYLGKTKPAFWLVIGVVIAVCIGFADFFTGRELAFSLFYLFPIVLVTWFVGRNLGLVLSMLSAIIWFTSDALSGETYSQPIIRYWNAGVRLGFFVVVTLLIPALKALEQEKEIARVDYLTGAANRRFFFEVAQSEIDRAQRYKHPLALVYIDLDDFKSVNDKFGHRTGDEILCAVAKLAKSHIRKTDMIARLGGDEFVILLPETNQDAALVAVSKIKVVFDNEMHKHGWPITFSIGVLTCLDAHITVDDFMMKADAVMYSVKRKGKNAIAYAVYTDIPNVNESI